ncbi:hypothetical protein ACFXNW_10575 [Nocardia sp. NPDC059180]|uniref:hypothetical protein n=1 Tax=Nocardia sp. NPDC059180 TaxID=3346761 RepID=UPI0036A3FEB8
MNGERQTWATLRSVFGVVMAAVAVGGCTPDETAAPRPVTINDYGQTLSEEMQRRLWVAAKIRALDPCGFMNMEQVSGLGEVAQFGLDPYHGPESCRAAVVPPGRQAKSFGVAEIVIDLDREAPDADEHPLDSDDGIVYADTLYNGGNLGCGRLIRLDIPEARDTSGRSVDGAFMSVVADGFGRGPDGDNPQLNCEIAEQLTTGVVGLIRSKQPPQRSVSETAAPLGDRTSCDLVEHLPPDFRVTDWVPTTSPYLCDFGVAGPGVDANDGRVRAQIDTRPDKDAIDPGPLETDAEPARREVDGHPILLLRNEDDECRARMPVGDVMDGNRPGFELDDHDVSVARVRAVVELDGSCTALESLLPAMVEAFARGV